MKKMIRDKIKEIAENIEMFSMEYDYTCGKYIFKFKNLKIKRDEYDNKKIFLSFNTFWNCYNIPMTIEEKVILKKFTNKIIDNYKEKKRIKKNKKDNELFERGTKLLDKINFN